MEIAVHETRRKESIISSSWSAYPWHVASNLNVGVKQSVFGSYLHKHKVKSSRAKRSDMLVETIKLEIRILYLLSFKKMSVQPFRIILSFIFVVLVLLFSTLISLVLIFQVLLFSTLISLVLIFQVLIFSVLIFSTLLPVPK